jgi:hypothetical protein
MVEHHLGRNRRELTGNHFDSQMDFSLFDLLQRHPHVLRRRLLQSLQVHSCTPQILVSEPVSIVTLDFEILSSTYFLEYEILVPGWIQVLVHGLRLAYELLQRKQKEPQKRTISSQTRLDTCIVSYHNTHTVMYVSTVQKYSNTSNFNGLMKK